MARCTSTCRSVFKTYVAGAVGRTLMTSAFVVPPGTHSVPHDEGSCESRGCSKQLNSASLLRAHRARMRQESVGRW